MQLDMFGATEESAINAVAPPVVSAAGAWTSPEVVVFNAALQRGALRDAIATLNRLKLSAAVQVLLASGFTIRSTDTRAELMAGVQAEILAAVTARKTAFEMRAAAPVAPSADLQPGNDGEAVEPSIALTPDVRLGEPITADVAAAMRPGMRVLDGSGKEYQAFSARHDYLQVFPIGPDGKAEIFDGNSVFFHLDPSTADAYPSRTHGAIFLKDEISLAPPGNLEHTALIDNAIIAPGAKESENHGATALPGQVRPGAGGPDRGDGRDRAIDREPVDDGLAGADRSAGGVGIVPDASQGADRAGEGRIGGSGRHAASVAHGDPAVERNPGIAPDDVIPIGPASPSTDVAARIARRYAEVLAQGRDDISPEPIAFHHKFAADVLARDAYALKWIVNGLNDKSKQVFAEFTGTKLPKAQGAAWQALREWAGVTPEQDAAVEASAESERASKRQATEDEAAEHDATMQRFRASATDPTVITGKEVVDRQIAEGHTDIRNISTTRIPKYVLANLTTNRYYPLDKVAKRYAEVALRRIGLSAASVEIDPDTIISVDEAAADAAEHERELRDAAARGQTMISDADAAHLFGIGNAPQASLAPHTDEQVQEPEIAGAVPAPMEPAAANDVADYVMSDADRIGLGSLGEKFQDNLTAIRLLRTLAAEQRHAVGDERRQLARYVGWGGLKGVFDPQNKQWSKQHAALRALLTETEWAAASRSQLNAFYTAPVVAKAMYSAVSRLGFTNGRILEPSVGVGSFFGLMPESMRQNSALHGVELDAVTSEIVAALYPSANIAKATGFQQYNVPAQYFDLAIGNPPFGSEAIVDEMGSAYSGWSIHNYFFAKSIELLRPGGIMPMVVSHNFLDKLDPHVRQWIGRRAELVSGVRLPNSAFKENANTEVVTDILVFRRLDNENTLGEVDSPDWLGTSDVSIENPKTGEFEQISINNYFLNNPENVLGTNSTTGSMYRANEYTVLPNGDLETQLAQWVDTLPQGIYVPLQRAAAEVALASVDVPAFVKEGSFFVKDNVVWERLPDAFGQHRTQLWEPANQRALDRMIGMIEIREALRGQMRLERSPDAGEVSIEEGRRELNRLYDTFQRKNGFLNDPINRRLFLDDTESALIQALEFDYERAITPAKAEEYGIEPRASRAVKADIFSRRVLFPPVEVEIVETAKDALLHSLNQYGRVDMDYMESAYGKPSGEIIRELGDLLFVDPVRGLVTTDEYLSGDVKTKLAEATKAALNDPALQRNVDALQAVIPTDKLPSEIHAAIGAQWVPAKIFSQFAKEISGAEPIYTYVKATGQWLQQLNGAPDFTKNNSEFGTTKLGALEILTQTMNSRGLEVKKKVTVDGSERYVTDEEATEAVRQSSDKIRAHWDSWLWADGDRADSLTKIYNDRFNRTVERHFDGAHLTFPGMNPSMALLSHQKNGVWRGLQDRSMLLDQTVGAGKTFEIVAMTMEMRRLGITKKPLIAVPNHLTLQWRSEFYRLYPGANVLAATPADFDKENRERFFSKIVTGNWDAVIVGHSSLKKIAVPVEMETKIIKEQFDDIADAIEDMKRDRGDRNVIRDMEKIKANLEAKLTKLKAKGGKKDNVVDFADLGIDALAIDEVHEFKNLAFTTQMNRVSGLGNPAGSGKAFDLFVKVRYMRETYGASSPLITATGTPVSNSLAEMFTMQRFMQYDALKANGLHVFDSWAKQFGDVQNVYEVAPSGTGYRLSQRFAKFKNLPALMGAYRSFADVITLDDLKAQEIAQGKTFPVPKLVGGRPLNVVAQRSELQEKFFGIPEIVKDDAGQIKFEVDLSYPITISARADGKFVRLQEVDGHTTTSQGYATAEEAEYMTALGAITPVMTVDPKSIVGQFENLRQLTRDTKGKINALSLTGLANKAGLDYRLIDPNAIDFPDSKVNIAVHKMVHIAKKWESDKGVQLVFCDLSVPLSAKAKMASKEKRVYVRDERGEVVHKMGTLHTVKDYEGLPYYLVMVGKGAGKTFSMYDPVCGALMKGGFDSKQEAHSFVAKFIANEGGQERWLDQREASRAIGADEIDEYKAEAGLDADGDAADLEITSQDIEGATGVAGFSIYDDMKAKLIAAGIPAHHIEFIHDHDTPQAKDSLFKRVNAGDVRFLFGSTPKMGAGTNVQQRLVALHHIDAPWRPSDLEQREGRIIRRGNLLYERDPEGFMVEVNRYATAQTYDTRRWQLLEHKAAGLEQLRNYDGANEIDDVANEASNSADMKAAASGNPLILKETQLSNEVKKLKLLERAYRDGEYTVRSRLNSMRSFVSKYGPGEIAHFEKFLSQRDGATVLGEFKGQALHDKEAVMAGVERVAKALGRSEEGVSLTYRGLPFQFRKHAYSLGETYVMETPDNDRAQMEKLSPSGVVTRMENWCNGLESQIGQVERRIVASTREAEKLEGVVGRPFAQADALLGAIAEHGKVQRALMKSNSMAAVKPEEMGAFNAAVAARKAALRDMGFGRAVSEIENEGELESATPGRTEATAAEAAVSEQSPSQAKQDGPLMSVQGEAAPTVDMGEPDDMERYIKVAADSIAELRKTDVFRVLIESNRAQHRQAIASYIKRNRPDLCGEVDEVLEEARAEFRKKAVAAAAGKNEIGDAQAAVDIQHLKTRMVDALAVDAPVGAIVMNAPRPLIGNQTMDGDFVTGRHYAVITPSDPMAGAFVEENRKLDARLLVIVPRETQMALALHGNPYREKYLSLNPDERYARLGNAMEKFRDMPYGELTKAIAEARGIVTEGLFSGVVLDISNGVAVQKVNREGDTVKHDVSKLSAAVSAGDLVDIKYRNGVGEVISKGKSVGVEL